MSVPMLPQVGAPMIAKRDLDTKLRRADAALEVHPTNFRRRIIPYDERLTEPDRAMLTARLSHLRACMQSDPAMVRAQISLMRVTYKSYSTAEEANIELAVWVNQLSKRPGWAVQETVERFLDGRVPGADNRRGPTLSEFCIELSHLIEPINAEIIRLERVLNAEVDEPICPQYRAKAQRDAAAIIAGVVSSAKFPNSDVGNPG